jgi:hypothetical protein
MSAPPTSPPPKRKNIDAINPIEDEGYKISTSTSPSNPQPTFDDVPNKNNYPYANADPGLADTDPNDSTIYEDTVNIPAFTSTTPKEDTELLSLINKSISKLVADIKKTYLGGNNTDVNTNVTKIIDLLNNITTEITKNVPETFDEVDSSNPDKITRNNEYFKIVKDGENGYTYLKDENFDGIQRNQHLFKTPESIDENGVSIKDASGNIMFPSRPKDKSVYRIKPVNSNADSIDSMGTPTLANEEYQNLITDPPNPGQVQKRLDNCYTLELLYMKKHEEILKLFAFILNLFDKYKYAIKLILYLLKSLVYRPTDCKGCGTGIAGTGTGADVPIVPTVPINVRLPKPLITQIGLMVADQEKIQSVVDNIKLQTETLSKPITT